MNRKANRFILLLGILFSLLAGIVIGKALRYRNSPALALLSHVPARTSPVPFQTDLSTDDPASTGEQPTNHLSQPGEIPKENQDWMRFDQMDLLDADLGFTFVSRCDSNVSISIPPIKIIPWHQGIFETDEFGIGKNVAVGWEHMDYDGLWIHSGWDFWAERSPATDLQYFIETNSINEVQPLEDIQHKLNDCLIGSQVNLEQLGQTTPGRVTAAVRVPAVGVAELSKHTMDLVPYLAQAYPESGFEGLGEDALLIYFCGRAALDERTDPDAGYWTQTRYVIALEPQK